MNDAVLKIVGRKEEIFSTDLPKYENTLSDVIRDSRFLVIGGAGSIGSAVVLEIFKRFPKQLHVVDISENNLVELVRNIRSSLGYISGEFKTFAIDCGSKEFEALFSENSGYDFVLNLSALKHVRSESNPYTLMRMLQVNVENTIKIHDLCEKFAVRKHFCVSSDKAANPANLMGATKRLMEKALFKKSVKTSVSMARFANVAFSDGSLLHGFRNRILKVQPISAPNDVKRYFMTDSEAGLLCLFSCILGNHCDIFFPIHESEIKLISFDQIAVNFLESEGFTAEVFTDEKEARLMCSSLAKDKKWACYFFTSDTTGEKSFEEFYTENESILLDRFSNIGVIENCDGRGDISVPSLLQDISNLRGHKHWSKGPIVDVIEAYVPEFRHNEKNKYLDEKM